MEVKSLNSASQCCLGNFEWSRPNVQSFKGRLNLLQHITATRRQLFFNSAHGRYGRTRINNSIKITNSSAFILFSQHTKTQGKSSKGVSVDLKFHSPRSFNLLNGIRETNYLISKSANDCLKAVAEALIKCLQRTFYRYNNNESGGILVLEGFRRLAAVIIVFLALGFSPHRALQGQAWAAPAIATVSNENNIRNENVENDRGNNNISAYKRELLETVAVLEQRLEELRALDKDKTDAKVQTQMQKLREVLEVIGSKSQILRSKALIDMEAGLALMKREETKLLKKAENIADSYLAIRTELQRMPKQQAEIATAGDEKMRKLRERRENDLREAENRFRDVWSKITRLEADLLVKEIEGLRLAFEEIPAIEEQSRENVDVFIQQMDNMIRAREYQGYSKESIVERIEKDLEYAGKKIWEQRFLPSAVDIEEPQLPVNEEKRELVEHIKRDSQKSREMQEKLDNLIRDRFKEVGEEKLLLVKTPEEEVVKGLPPVELKWLFGDKEVHVPGAASFQMAQGWKKWREEAKANLKKKLLEDVELGKEYIAQRQARILLYRDRVMAGTWYNENEKRWEMDPFAASYAVSKELVGRARIRHDRALMYIALKGDDREYYVDVVAFDVLFEQVGGFDGLYVKMVASGIPTTIEFMSIPFKEWGLKFQLLVPLKLCYRVFNFIWSNVISEPVFWYLGKLNYIIEEVMVRVGFPIIEFIIPQPIRTALGLAWPEAADATVASTWYLVWQMEAEKNVQARQKQDTSLLKRLLGFAFSCFLYGYPLLLAFRYLWNRILGGQDMPETPLQEKQNMVRKVYKEMHSGVKKTKADPIEGAFDRMKRIKNPPMHLKDLAGIDAVKEEVNEVVSFLKNPKSFQEIGARAPRGVLIAGDSGTGKTTLAYAIAAEAKVPVVEIKALDLEGGAWVGQGAANVRELFQTARELAPLIIFMDDFDLFAGVRGQKLDTKMQDHEALINQLLVELDGFETQEGVVFMATTRKPGAIDEALRRPGRMDRTITLPMPDEREREMILRSAALTTMHGDVVNFVDWKKVAKKTMGLTPAQLKFIPQSLESSAFHRKICDDEELFSIYGWLATINSITPRWLKHSEGMKKLDQGLVDHLGLRLTEEDMESTIELMEPYGQIKPGLELRNPPTIWTREFKFPHAVWAAGRGLMALLLPNFDSVDHIWLDPTSWEGIGFTKLTRQTTGELEDSQAMTRSYLEKKLVLCFGSYIAARLLLPSEESNNLSTFEIEEAEELATRMVLEYGWGPNDSTMVYLTRISGNHLDMGKDHEYELESNIKKLFNTACDKAAEILKKNQKALVALVEHLLEYDVVTKQEMSRILKANGSVQEPEPFMLISCKSFELAAGMSTNGTGRFSGTPQPSSSGF